MFNKVKEPFLKILFISKLSKSINKKISTLIVILLANLSALLDILIILSLSSLFSRNLTENSIVEFYLDFYNDNKYILLLVVVIRFVTLFLQKIYSKKIELVVDEDLKKHLTNEVFQKNNFSISDSLFFVNILSQHISFFYSSFINFLTILTQIFAYLIFLITTNLIVLNYTFIIFLILFYPIKKLFSLARSSMHNSYISSKEVNNFIQNIIENVFLIKIYNKGNDEIEKISHSLSARTKFLFINDIYGSLTALIPTFLVFTIFSIVAFSEKLLNLITIDFLGITLRLFQSISILANAFSRMINSYVHIEELEIIEKNKQSINQKNFKQTESFYDESNLIEIRNVSFSYFKSNDLMFENLNLEIKKNNQYLISGQNGSGKSTLLALMTGILLPNEGEVICNTKKIAYVGPNPLIVDGTLKENILYGNVESVDENYIKKLVSEIKLFDDIKSIDLNLKINNKSLSSGQTQKLAFIRAFIRNCELLILDESTANLDIETKNLIVKKLKNQKNLTIINSTHDLELFDFIKNRIQIKFDKNIRVVEVN